jgi:hypothetical protein
MTLQRRHNHPNRPSNGKKVLPKVKDRDKTNSSDMDEKE